jgi:hypothetical protein
MIAAGSAKGDDRGGRQETEADEGDKTRCARTLPGCRKRRARTARRAARVFWPDHCPNEIDNPEKRRQWGLPPIDAPLTRGFYIVELNVQYSGGLSAAEHEFRERFRAAMAQAGSSTANRAAPLRISKSYFRCSMTDAEWKQLVENDERRTDADRVIYKLWPDFPVRPQTDRSINTVKADAAMRAFNAAGAGIVWAVSDSGVDMAHLHFGSQDNPLQHLLLHPDVADLHRCFADVALENGNVVRSDSQPDSPDWDLGMEEKDRRRLVDLHRTLAWRDEYGHGTHVAGIISGRAPAQGLQVLERQYTLDPDGHKLKESYGASHRSSPASRLPIRRCGYTWSGTASEAAWSPRRRRRWRRARAGSA